MMDKKSSFTKPLKIEHLPDGINKRVLVPYRFWFEYQNKSIAITIPYGFISDGASIPCLLWPIIGSPWRGKYVQAAIMHDLLYRKIGNVICVDKQTNKYKLYNFDRDTCDKLLVEGARRLGCSEWKVNLIYLGLKMGGFVTWNRYVKKINT